MLFRLIRSLSYKLLLSRNAFKIVLAETINCKCEKKDKGI